MQCLHAKGGSRLSNDDEIDRQHVQAHPAEAVAVDPCLGTAAVLAAVVLAAAALSLHGGQG